MARNMKNSLKACNIELLDRYMDQELGPEELCLVDKHVAQCPSCRRALRDNKAVAELFRAKMDQELSRVNLQAMEARVVAAIHAQRITWWSRLQNLFVSKRFYVPVTAVAAGLALLVVFMTPSPSVSGPSAIISSLKGDVGSVMILETPKTHQTVIWFNEPVSPNGQNGGHGPEGNSTLGVAKQRLHIA
jgi:predicted anti-sigma-YlaC factor YlaD